MSCTTIDYFDAWPQTALMSVAEHFMNSTLLRESMEAGEEFQRVNDKLVKNLCLSCVGVHTGVKSCANDYTKKMDRICYATPKSYVDMLSLYLSMLSERRGWVEKRLKSLNDGVQKLEETNETVVRLQKELSSMQPNLEKKAKGATELLKEVELEQKKATEVQGRVSQDEADVTQRQGEVSALRTDAQRDLARAMPAYQNAVKALESLDKNDIIEIRSFKSPPLVVQTVMEAVCILLGEQPTWESAKKVLNRPSYMEDLANFDKDNITPNTLAKINKYIENPDMAPENVKTKSVAAAGMCMWVHAMNVYSQIASEVAPKQERLNKMNKELDKANEELLEKRNMLTSVMEEVARLQKKCDDTLTEKNRLAVEVNRCSQRLVRAEKLTFALKDERVRWIETAGELEEEKGNLLGDVFLGAAVVSYLGPFSQSYRKLLKNTWKEKVEEMKIPVSVGFDFVKRIGNVVQVREPQSITVSLQTKN